MGDNTVVAIFPSRKKLLRALDHLMEQPIVPIERASVVSRAESGEAVIVGDDLGADEGGLFGGVVGVVLCVLGLIQIGVFAFPTLVALLVLGGGIVLGAWVGRVVGRFAANVFDFGMADDLLETFTQQLQTGRSALVLQLGDDYTSNLAALQEALTPFGVEFIDSLRTAISQPAPVQTA